MPLQLPPLSTPSIPGTRERASAHPIEPPGVPLPALAPRSKVSAPKRGHRGAAAPNAEPGGAAGAILTPGKLMLGSRQQVPSRPHFRSSMARTLLGLNGRPRGRVGYSRPISGEAAGSTTMSPRVLLMMATSSASSVAGTLNFRIECPPLLDPQQPFPSFCIISQQSDKPIMSEQTWFEQRQTKFRATVNFSLGQQVLLFCGPEFLSFPN